MHETVLLMGLPNVGKSVIFNHLTGLNVRVANYTGTTVEYTAGKMKLGNKSATLVDVPGTYSLNSTNEAEKIAVEMLQGKKAKKTAAGGSHCEAAPVSKDSLGQPSAVICVLDACNLESSLFLLLQVLERGLPTLAVLNRMDLAREKGCRIDPNIISREVGTYVITTVAVTGEGIETLKSSISDHLLKGQDQPPYPRKNATWETAEFIVKQASIRQEAFVKKKHSREHWGELLTKPWPGLPIAMLVLGIVLGVVVGVGMGLRQFLLLPFFRNLVFPQIEGLVTLVFSDGIIRNILIGDYGFLIKGLEWPFALVFPYVISFYAALSFLEDSGYLPRLGILVDGLLNRLGTQGSGIIALLLGYGCAIPAILATRALNSYKERLIITTMICFAVPCIAQTGAFISLLSVRSIPVMLTIFVLAVIAMITVALILDRMLKGPVPETLADIPELLLPRREVLAKKLWLRTKSFLTDGALPMVVGVAIAAILFESGIMVYLGEIMRPLVVDWLGLPSDAAVPLILGILRRELTVLPLLDMNLTTLQLFVGATVGLFYVPCIAVIASLSREFGLRIALGILILTTAGAFLIGGIIFQIGSLLT